MNSAGVGGEPARVSLADGTVLVTVRGRVLDIRLNRPHKRNALTADMIDALHEAVDLADERGASVVCLRGAPGVFCAGADIAGYVDATANLDFLRAFTSRAAELCDRLADGDHIVVAVVDGLALGGGFELVLASDLVVASTRTQFGLPEVALGLIPGWGGTQRVAQHFGPNRGNAIVLAGSRLSAEQAGSFVTELAEPDVVDAIGTALVDGLAERAPLALRAAKIALRAARGQAEGAAVAGPARERSLLLELFATEDGIEGVAAFVAKRAPHFVGR